MSDQTAKADAGKIMPTLVDPNLVRSVAKIEECDQEAEASLMPKMLYKTQKIGYAWKAMFECPYCGTQFEAYITNVMRKKTRSCGCMRGRFMVQSKGTHGETRTRLYRIWHHILERCNSKSCKEYKWYGARGIRCEFSNYEEFRNFALNNGYTDELTVERIDVNGNYSPSNVAFILLRFQARNTRSNVMITYKGLTLCASEWAEILGINADTLTKRIREGWSTERAVETPVKNSLDISLVPVGVIKALRETRLYGIKKYGDSDNWKRVEPQRYRDAAYRHWLAYLDDPEGVDAESGLPHLYHMVTNLAFLIELDSENRSTERSES